MTLKDISNGPEWVIWVVFVVFAILSITLLTGHGASFICLCVSGNYFAG